MGDYVPPQKHFGIIVTINAWSERVAHTPTLNHLLGKIGGLFEIIGRPGSHLPHKNFLRDSPTHQHSDSGEKIIPVVAVSIFFRQLHRNAQGPATRNDSDLMDRVCVRTERSCNDRMPGFMVSSVLALQFRHHQRASFYPHNNLVLSQLKFFHRDQLFTPPGRK